ncbi:MAG: HNH endonuclease [Aestuariibacter sp.]|nr:HNH endonuclease [Aestuariibacter sp.]
MPKAPQQHRPAGWKPRKAWATTTKTNTERGYSTAWRKLRKIIIRRDQGLCQACRRKGKVTAGRDVDHITPKSRGGTDSVENLQLLCVACHKSKTATEKR